VSAVFQQEPQGMVTHTDVNSLADLKILANWQQAYTLQFVRDLKVMP
jgi:hypothetical protein